MNRLLAIEICRARTHIYAQKNVSIKNSVGFLNISAVGWARTDNDENSSRYFKSLERMVSFVNLSPSIITTAYKAST